MSHRFSSSSSQIAKIQRVRFLNHEACAFLARRHARIVWHLQQQSQFELYNIRQHPRECERSTEFSAATPANRAAENCVHAHQEPNGYGVLVDGAVAESQHSEGAMQNLTSCLRTTAEALPSDVGDDRAAGYQIATLTRTLIAQFGAGPPRDRGAEVAARFCATRKGHSTFP